MTQEQQDKQAFFAQYWGQKVRKWEGMPDYTGLISSTYATRHIIEHSYLELTPLSAITDEDAIEVSNILDADPTPMRDQFHVRFGRWDDAVGVWFDGEILIDGEQRPLSILQAYDYLRSRGYLLPFRQYSTQQLLDMGWAKIKITKIEE